jgi:transposase
MRKMQDYIAKGKGIFIGLEDSKRTWKISCRSEKMEIHYTSMPADYTVLRSYLRNRYPECRIAVIYEAGFKGFGLHDRLVEDGYGCVVTPPNKVTQEKASRVKTDKIDCRRLATNLENGDFKRCHVPDREILADRQISRTLIAIQKDLVRTRNRIRKFLDFHGIDKGFPAGAWSTSDYDRLMQLELGGMLGISLNVLKELLSHLLSAKKLLKQELLRLTKKERYAAIFKIFNSAPGIGWFTAIRLVLEWGEDLSRFKTAKKFGSFTGLTASEYSTGETVLKGNITGQGNRSVRAWLIESAWTALRFDPVLLKKYNDIAHRCGNKKKAIVAVARKLAVRLWRCAMNKETYCIGLLATD